MQATFTVPAKSQTFAISFKLPAAEYLLKTNIGPFLDKRKTLTDREWNTVHIDFSNVDAFVQSASLLMAASLSSKIDTRKLALFNEIYDTAGTVMIEQLAEMVHWKSRQINRYFQGHFGLPLKKYCNILRFRASFDHLQKGQLFPVPGYFDQSHFIRDVHKFSDTSPKHLANNEKDRFIQLSTLTG
jgi:AraC-like DNA-binding protein